MAAKMKSTTRYSRNASLERRCRRLMSRRHANLLGCLLKTYITILVPLPFEVRAQQAPNPFLQVPFLEEPELGTFRYNLCPLSQQVLGGSLKLGDALDGVDLSIALWQGEFVNWNIAENTENTNLQQVRTLNPDYAGLVPALLDELCVRAGCTWRTTYTALPYDAIPDNVTFTDLLTWSTAIYDLSAEWWMRSVERLQAGATFTEQWYDGTIILVAPKAAEDGDDFNPWGWLAPFSQGVWLMVLGTIAASSVIYWLLDRFNPASDHDLDGWELIWQMATASAGQFEFDPQTPQARLFTFSIAFWALLMVSAYTANLASFLVIRNQPGVEIQSLQQAVQLNKRMCVWKASQTDASITKAFPTYAGSARLVRTNQRGVYEGLQTGECDLAITEMSSWDVFQNDESINSGCRLAWIGRPFQNIPASFGVKADSGNLCTSLLRDVFNLHLHNMQVDGTMETLWEQHIAFVSTVDCGAVENSEARGGRRLLPGAGFETHVINVPHDVPEERSLRTTGAKVAAAASSNTNDADSDTFQLTLLNMGGVFLLHGMISVLALLLAFVPWVCGQCKRRVYEEEEKKPSALKQQSQVGGQTKSVWFSSKTDEPREGPKDTMLPENFENEEILSSEGQDSQFYFDSVSHPFSGTVSEYSLEALRSEFAQRLGSIEDKMSALLAQTAAEAASCK